MRCGLHRFRIITPFTVLERTHKSFPTQHKKRTSGSHEPVSLLWFM